MPFHPGFRGAPSAVQHAFLHGADAAPSTTSHTFASLNFGAASANRYLVVHVVSPTNITAVTIGGVSATNFLDPGSFGSMWIAAVPTGTSGDVVVSAAANIGRVGIQLYSLKNISSSTPHDTASNANGTGTSVSASLDVPARGVIIGGGGFTVANSNTTWGGLTEDYDNIGAFNNVYTSASLFSAAAQSGVSVTASTPSGSNAELLCASWGPP